MTSFIPATGPAGPAAAPIRNEPFYPDLSPADFHAETGLGEIFAARRVAAVLTSAMAETNATLAEWRAGLPADAPARLAELPSPALGGESVKVLHYRTAVFARARACLLETTRDHDSTSDGHDRADAQGDTADIWLERAHEALSRLTGRSRMTVVLIYGTIVSHRGGRNGHFAVRYQANFIVTDYTGPSADLLFALLEWLHADNPDVRPDALAALEPGQRAALFREIGTEPRRRNQARMQARTDPDGRRWRSRRQAADGAGQVRRSAKMFPKLRRLKWLRLAGSPGGLTIGWRGRVARLAAVHHQGDVFSDRTPVPERPLIGLSDDDIAFVRDALLDSLAGG